MDLPHVVYRLVSDESFRDLFRATPEKALAGEGLTVSQEAREVLVSVRWELALAALSRPVHDTDGPDRWWLSQFSHSLIHARLSAAT